MYCKFVLLLSTAGINDVKSFNWSTNKYKIFEITTSTKIITILFPARFGYSFISNLCFVFDITKATTVFLSGVGRGGSWILEKNILMP